MAGIVAAAAAPFTGALAVEPLTARLALECPPDPVGTKPILPSLWLGTVLEVSDLESSMFRLGAGGMAFWNGIKQSTLTMMQNCRGEVGWRRSFKS